MTTGGDDHVLESIDVREHRFPEHPVEPLLVERWSPRAMSGEPISRRELLSLFEAARWAPSSYNNQPWRFVWARRDTPAWDPLFGLLVDFNQRWSSNAAVLIAMLSRRSFERSGKPSRTHSFDTGAAWMGLALQGTAMGLVVHGMEGFDYDRARDVLDVPEELAVEAMAAVGRPAPVESLPERLQEREQPSGRKTVQEIAFEGRFGVAEPAGPP
ncbi:MAG: nitroreductase family protein [Thermoanaerobaculia bacterium]